MIEGSMDRIKENIEAWLKEDIGTGDVTSISTIPAEHQSIGYIHAKEMGMLAGLPIAKLVFEIVDPNIIFSEQAVEGSILNKGDTIATVEGNTRNILIGERLALNLMQRLSGIATKTNQYVKELNNIPVKVVDTRKTTPGHRVLEKYAVKVGGGFNHRMGLYDAVMIKDNHIKATGSIKKAIEAARNQVPHTMKIEVEIEKMTEIEEALAADIILLDNMSIDTLTACVNQIKAKSPHIILEASGGITLETIRGVALTGVDVISVGGLTTSVKNLDISLDLNEKKVIVQ
ncbi:carboxylating nicotinate-nucleotide diphosphorylase [Chengkuizengella axinellae]|uniref:nicotinate-nucleotide diphosphorylase (carboxylating) n=1 Tax=Chengkuizengella axinellae TaxID=3064388 RepID=A0ABT9J5S1_9BACL|nr:carboxylating nicotinate-nucleotide diphosphorylase [Chengkuizengella sp. 2205SS18-9]MDP5276966.1 carboxylating nicotinate-nucleotide diphosphorylase [Chengkuizengella sp. 2205SS18-9]